MNLRKKECLLQSIRKNRKNARGLLGPPASGILGTLQIARRATVDGKESGQIGLATGLFSVLFLGAFLCALLQMELYRTASLYLEDALAASNLASAVVDVKEYGTSHKILIEDANTAYERYQQAIKGNLNLSDAWEGQEGGVIQGRVQIMNYTIYNVDGNEVTVYHYNENGYMTSWKDTLGSTSAPNGIAIESTSIYSEITFMVKGLFGIEVQAYKGNLADITR